jgi:hypothetical protein
MGKSFSSFSLPPKPRRARDQADPDAITVVIYHPSKFCAGRPSVCKSSLTIASTEPLEKTMRSKLAYAAEG